MNYFLNKIYTLPKEIQIHIFGFYSTFMDTFNIVIGELKHYTLQRNLIDELGSKMKLRKDLLDDQCTIRNFKHTFPYPYNNYFHRYYNVKKNKIEGSFRHFGDVSLFTPHNIKLMLRWRHIEP